MNTDEAPFSWALPPTHPLIVQWTGPTHQTTTTAPTWGNNPPVVTNTWVNSNVVYSPVVVTRHPSIPQMTGWENYVEPPDTDDAEEEWTEKEWNEEDDAEEDVKMEEASDENVNRHEPPTSNGQPDPKRHRQLPTHLRQANQEANNWSDSLLDAYGNNPRPDKLPGTKTVVPQQIILDSGAMMIITNPTPGTYTDMRDSQIDVGEHLGDLLDLSKYARHITSHALTAAKSCTSLSRTPSVYRLHDHVPL